MIVGSVLELKESEKRVGLIPAHAEMYVNNGHRVIVESGLGRASGFSDKDYLSVGAEVVSGAKDVWDMVDMIIKVKEPMPSEFDLMREGQIIFTYLHLAANYDLTVALMDKKVKAVAYETITNNNNDLVLLRPMSEIAGKLAITEANKYLESHYGGKGILLSGTTNVKPGHVLIVGAGSVGYSAMREAYNLGASVTALVRSEEKRLALLSRFNNDAEVLISSEENITASLKKADVVVSSVLVAGAKAQQLIKKDHLKIMEKGSVIIDVAIDQGGSTETSRPTTHRNPIYIEDGIIHYCVANMAGAVPKTASVALGFETIKYGLLIANKGLEKAAQDDVGIKKGINVYNGHLVNDQVGMGLGIESSKLKLI